MRMAFGTFLGVPDPITTFGDRDYVRTRWLTEPNSAFGAEVNDELVGSNFVTSWGSVGFFGPLTVRPDMWDQGIAKRLLEPTMELFVKWGTKHLGLFTFAQSAKHVHLYQKVGFWPRFLTSVMSSDVKRTEPTMHSSKYSELPEKERVRTLEVCRNLTNSIYQGLDLAWEIRAVNNQRLGDTVLLWDDSTLVGLAVCHCGSGTEAGNDTCYIKFGAVRPCPKSSDFFDRLLDACDALASSKGLSHIAAGMNLGRHEAYRKMIERGFRTDFQGVAMQRPNEPGYNLPNVYLIDDWR